ncbi:MAG: hypothetical protein ACLQVY_24795 [Limisphaerales bacterium]
MKKLQTLAVLAGAAMLFNAEAVFAGMANGIYTNEMGSLEPLWDVSGDYTNSLNLASFNYTLSQAASGKLSGAGKFTFVGTYDGIDFHLTNGVLKGSGAVTGAGSAQKAAITLTGSGTGTATYGGIALKITKFTLSTKGNGEIDGTNKLIIGTISFTLDVAFVDTANHKTKSYSKKETYKDSVIPLPATATGAWSLALDLTPNGSKKYKTGSATVLTSAGDTATFSATGTYTSSKDTSAILLAGTGASKGRSLSLGISTSGTNLNVETLSGSLFGQSLKYQAP